MWVPGVHLTLPINFSPGWAKLQARSNPVSGLQDAFQPRWLPGRSHGNRGRTEREWLTNCGKCRRGWIQVLCGSEVRMESRHQSALSVIPSDNLWRESGTKRGKRSEVVFKRRGRVSSRALRRTAIVLLLISSGFSKAVGLLDSVTWQPSMTPWSLRSREQGGHAKILLFKSVSTVSFNR